MGLELVGPCLAMGDLVGQLGLGRGDVDEAIYYLQEAFVVLLVDIRRGVAFRNLVEERRGDSYRT